MQKEQIFVIKDTLRHPHYNWPATLIGMPTDLAEAVTLQDEYVLIGPDGGVVPFQFAVSRDRKASADVYFITDMPSGTTREYCLKHKAQGLVGEAGEKPVLSYRFQNDFLQVTNGSFTIELTNSGPEECTDRMGSGTIPCFTIIKPGHPLKGTAWLDCAKKPVTVSSVPLRSGQVFHEHEIKYVFEDASVYRIVLRVILGMDFIEMEEEILGFSADEGSRLKLVWEGLNPGMRYFNDRGHERIDDFIDREGKMPCTLISFGSWRDWYTSRLAVFSSETMNAGLMVRNHQKWEDGEYALWESSSTLGIQFYWDRNRLQRKGDVRWEYPLRNGSRSTAIAVFPADRDKQPGGQYLSGRTESNASGRCCYMEELWLWYGFLHLDKVKDWVLEWEEDRSQYPLLFEEAAYAHGGIRFGDFPEGAVPGPQDAEEYIFKHTASIDNVLNANPVSDRQYFTLVPLFDIAASRMTQEQFDRCKAACAFAAYVHMDEAYIPLQRMLGGHPNFLMDGKAAVGLMAALFPQHPHRDRWKKHFELAVARNLKYHTRPDVQSWEAEGGRWTENISCYAWAMINPMMRVASFIHKTTGDWVPLYPNITKVAGWVLNCLSAPVDGIRRIPPQGAHAFTWELPLVYRVLAESLRRYQPLLAEYMLHECPADRPGFEEYKGPYDLWRHLLDGTDNNDTGTKPVFRSAKYTGYGYVLRSGTGTPDEMSVHLLQIDEGPNYRWGRAGQGSCGMLHYFAAGKRYSWIRPEDAGDENFGDVQACCNFAILMDNHYRSIGRSELTEPMYDFGFAQYAQVNAGTYSYPHYVSRSVILSGDDYLTVYDQVGDMRVRGRFAWFAGREDRFPDIYQLKPGVPGYETGPGHPMDMNPAEHNSPFATKGLHFDGNGDFLTVVTHRQSMDAVSRTACGAEVRYRGRTDLIFRDGAEVHFRNEEACFEGYAGIIRFHPSGRVEAALFKGDRIGAAGVEVSLAPVGTGTGESCAGIGLTIEDGRFAGKYSGRGSHRLCFTLKAPFRKDTFSLYLDGEKCEFVEEGREALSIIIPDGRHSLQWTDRKPVPEPVEISRTVVFDGGVEVYWPQSRGAEGYKLAVSSDGGNTWRQAAVGICGNSHVLDGLENGSKVHLRIQPVNTDAEGTWSGDYPVHVTGKVPPAPEGLRVWRTNKPESTRITWGWLLGVRTYRLYRRAVGTGVLDLVYEGQANEFDDCCPAAAQGVEYCVAAVNGNGEGPKSLTRDTGPGGLADWDPKPDEAFRRDTMDHHHGYNGFDPWSNEKRRTLAYPSGRT